MMQMPDITEQGFGVEMEVAGAARSVFAQAVADATDGRITAINQPGHDATVATDRLGRECKVQNDSSIAMINGHRGSEVVTPVLTYSDLPYRRHTQLRVPT